MKTLILTAGLATMTMVTGACQLDIERNADGSLQAEATISETDIATELGQVMQTREGQLSVDLKDGYAVVTATGPTNQFPHTESFAFDLELFVEDGHLGAEVSDAQWNGVVVPAEVVETWNEDIAENLEAGAAKHPNSTLVAVDITEDDVQFEFHIETPRSRG